MSTKKTDYFVTKKGHAIVELRAIPEGWGIRIYVKWDWEDQVRNYGYSTAYKSPSLYKNLSEKNIINACDYGEEMTPRDIEIIFGKKNN
jgi:hypothetical protein